MPRRALELKLPEDLAPDLEAFLESRFDVLWEAQRPRRVTLYDTFDWRLHNAGTLLQVTASRRGVRWSWRALDGGLRQQVWEPSTPGLLADVEDAGLRQELDPIVAMRRLLPWVEVSLEERLCRILDDETKTRVRLFWSHGHAQACETAAAVRTLPATLRLQGLRGYDKDFDALAEALTAFGCTPTEDDLLHRALVAAGAERRPGDYTSKPQLRFEATLPAAQAARQIHRALLDTMLRNEPGLRRDDDSEFLHDYRVAVRRTRSALSQIKKVFPQEQEQHFRGELSWLGSLTGPTRDLDVFLLKIVDYRRLLPDAVAADLDPLAQFLVRKQRREHRRLVAGLNSDRYRRLIASWRAFLDSPSDDDGKAPNAQRPIIDLANERIWKLFRRVVKDGRKVLAMTTDPEAHAAALHDLRIEGKKLRYGMELFRSLYPPQDIDPLVKSLKKLQDNLGDFNDYEVQRDKLAAFAVEMLDGETPHGETSDGQGTAASTLLAMGRLVAFLAEAQEKERLAFKARFQQLVAAPRSTEFHRLFAPR